jgi:hypothetical protein
MPTDHLGDLRLGDRAESKAEMCPREIHCGVWNWTELNLFRIERGNFGVTRA